MVVNRQGLIVSVNKALVEMTGYERTEKERVNEGLFRDDLFYRINVIPIILPPLRERREDVPLLARSFFQRMQLKTGKRIGGISDSVMRIFMEYPWPGNVRELRSAFEYAFVSCHDPVIQPRHLPPRLLQERRFRTMDSETAQDRAGRKKAELIDALKRAGGNRSEAARVLGVSRVTIWNRMRRFGIDSKQDFGDTGTSVNK